MSAVADLQELFESCQNGFKFYEPRISRIKRIQKT